jgi:hypothetical protein
MTMVAHADRVEITLDPARVDASRVEVLVSGPQGWTGVAGAVRPLPGGGANIRIDRGKWYVLRYGDKPHREEPHREERPGKPSALTAKRLFLPDRLIYYPPAGEGGAEGRPYRYATFVALAESPLPWNDQLSTYSGEIITGLVAPPQHGGEPQPSIPQALALDTPMSVELTANGAQVSPARLEIRTTGVSGFERAQVTSDKNATSRSITARSDLGDRTVVFSVAQQLGRIGLEPGNTKILGFGMGKTSIAVVREAEDGMPLTDPDTLPIHLNTTRGQLTPTTAEIVGGESHTSIMLESEGTGTAEITASGGGASGTVTVEFVAPLLLALATVIAGAAGGYLKWWKEGEEAQGSGLKLLHRMVIGVIVGVLFVAAVTTGLVNFGPTLSHAPTVAIAIVLGVVGGYGGTAIIVSILKQWRLGS